MREFSKGQSFHDNDGKLLHGRATFYKKGTTTYADIYDANGSPISNPIYTDNSGQLVQQVFLADYDYTVQFDKYVGNGIMEGETSNEYWVWQFSCIDLYDTFNITVDSKGLQVINTVAELRQTDPSYIAEHAGNKVVVLAGYLKAGDKPSIQYYWDDESTDTDDGGSIIKVSNISIGRWKFVPNQFDRYDVRHWGAFPAMSYSSLSDSQSYAIQSAYNYVASINSKIYFPQSEYGIGYYRITTTLNSCVFDTNTVVLIPDNISITISLAENSENFTVGQNVGYTGQLTIKGSHLHYNCLKAYAAAEQYNKLSFIPSERFDVDAHVYTNISFTDIDVYFTAGKSTISNAKITLTNCRIHSINAISNTMTVDFVGCEVRESMFATDNTLTNSTFTQCISTKKHWPTMSKYLTYWTKNGDKLLDLENETISTTFFLPRNTLIKNAKHSDNTTYILVQPAVTDIKIVDSDLNITFGSTPQRVLNLELINSTVGVTGNSFSKLSCTNSTFTMIPTITTPFITNGDIQNSVISVGGALANTAIISFTSICGIENSNINALLSVTEASTVIIKSCLINKDIATANASFYNNEINGTIRTYDKNGLIDFYMEGNKFRNGYHMLYAITPNTIVNGKWVNNSSDLPQHFIVIDRTNINPDETMHPYIYSGNHGSNVLQKYARQATPLQILSHGAAAPADGLKAYILSGVQIAIWMYGHPIQVAFFSVGTQNIHKVCEWSLSPVEYLPGVDGFSGVDKGSADRIFDTNVWAPTYSFPSYTKSLTDVVYKDFKNLEFVGGYMWKIGWGKPYTQGGVFYGTGKIDGDSPFDYQDKEWWTGLSNASRNVVVFTNVHDITE